MREKRKLKKRFIYYTGIFSVVLIFCFLTSSLLAQKPEATKDSIPKHSPKKAALFSAIVPGLGQAYNKKYWKIPIIYAGFAGLGYLVSFNNEYYNVYKKALLYRTDNDS